MDEIMFLTQDIFVILYNALFITIFLIWIFQEKLQVRKIVIQGNIKFLWIFSIFWLILALFMNTYILGSDVDDAIISGTKAFIDGSNPYSENVVTHLLNGEIVLGLYHYFPPDLLIYSFMYIIISPIESFSNILVDSWFLIANTIYLVISYLVVRKIINKPDSRLIPPFIIVTSMFLFTNSSLMVLFFVIGYYFFKIAKNYNLGVISYILAAGSKYTPGLFLIVHLLEEILNIRTKEDLLLFKPYIIGSIVFFITIIPFGLWNVLNATFIYQGDIVSRAEVAGIYGPVLVEIAVSLNLLSIFNFIFLISAVVSIFFAFKFGKNTYERQMILSFLFMFILPFYGTELFVVSLLLWYFNLFDEGLNFPETSSRFENQGIN